MIIEKLPFRADIKSLVEVVRTQIDLMSITWQGKEFGHKNFGGWSVLSRLGTCDDGWEIGADNCIDKKGKNYVLTPKGYNYKIAKYLNFSHAFEHVHKTPACIGEIERLIDLFEANGFHPRRARISLIKAGTVGTVHIDAPKNVYMARIHVPIITNEKCKHWTEYGEYHMPADGSVFMLPVNNYHQVRNESDIDRYHLIMDAYDTRGFTKNLKFSGTLEQMQTNADEFRRNINNTKISIIDRTLYWTGKQIYKLNKR